MPTPPPDPQKLETARRAVAAGSSWIAAAQKAGLSPTTVKKYLAGPGATRSHGPSRAVVDEFRRAAGVPDPADDDADEPVAVKWERAERDAARRIRRAAACGTYKWKAPGKHLLLSFLSDQHVAPGTPVDFKAMREDAERIARTPNCYAILGGDATDNHLKHRAAILSARSQPGDQYELFEYYLKIFGDRLLVMVSGNHDNWTNQFAGVDVLGRIAKDNRVFYNPDEAYLELTVGGQEYVVGVRHQYRYNSSFNQTHSPKQWLRLGAREFDIGCVCHHHEAAVEQTLYRGRFRWVCRPGSYQVTSAYSRQFGFNPSVPTSPTFLLRGDEREVYGWNGLSAALDCVRAMREIGV